MSDDKQDLIPSPDIPNVKLIMEDLRNKLMAAPVVNTTISIVQYDEQDGRITGVITGTKDNVERSKVGTYLEGTADPFSQYVHQGVVTNRPAQQTELVDNTLMGLPVPCLISIDGEAYQCEDEEAELDISMAGTYKIKVEAWPFLDKELELVIGS